jgi:hypothetical protein
MAQTGLHQSKHARKIHKKLASIPRGTLLRVIFRDGTDEFGTIGRLSESEFEFTDAKTSVTREIDYELVDRLQNGLPSSARRNVRRHGSIVFLVGIGAAVAVAVAILASQHD